MKSVFVSNQFPQVKRKVRDELQNRLVIAGSALVLQLQDGLNSGALPIESDTQALAQSLFVQTPKESDFNKALRRAEVAYLNNVGRWFQPVREQVTPEAYEKLHFQQRIGQEEALPLLNNNPRVGVGTMLAYGYWWYMGHYNVFTERDESPRDWIEVPSLNWAQSNLSGYFVQLL